MSSPQVRILVVDDEQSIVEFYQQILAPASRDEQEKRAEDDAFSDTYLDRVIAASATLALELVACRQGTEAVEAVRASLKEERPFAVAFLDVRMPPGPDGVWTAEQIRAIDPALILVMATAYTDVPPWDIANRIPPPHKLFYLQKPFLPQELYQLASALSAAWYAEHEDQTIRQELEQWLMERTAELTETNQELHAEILERKWAENALRASETQYRLLADHMASGLAIVQDGALVFVNHALSVLLTSSHEELQHMSPLALFHEADRALMQTWLARLEQEISEQPAQARCITAEGRVIWTEWHPALVAWKNRPALLLTIRDITESKQREIEMEQEKASLEERLKSSFRERYRFGEIIGKSPAMQAVYELIVRAAASEASVLICGESGTGKELVAQMIHQLSRRRDNTFLAVNCGAITDTLFESEFFGHKKGAFTGALFNKPGFFEVAHKGTLFLDEVGELSAAMQVKLLRALQNGEYTPVGATQSKHADVRILAATNRDLQTQLRKGALRKDFYYRIHVIEIALPPLRARPEDIPLLIEHFLNHYSAPNTPPTLPASVIEQFCRYAWPGNIRELQNEVQRYLTIQRLDFTDLSGLALVEEDILSDSAGLNLQEALNAFEKRVIRNALNRSHGQKGKAAQMLGIDRKTLYRKLKQFDL